MGFSSQFSFAFLYNSGNLSLLGRILQQRCSDELPRHYAASADPYADAAPRFSTTLAVRRVGDRNVYVLERTYHAVPGSVRRVWRRVEVKLKLRAPASNS